MWERNKESRIKNYFAQYIYPLSSHSVTLLKPWNGGNFQHLLHHNQKFSWNLGPLVLMISLIFVSQNYDFISTLNLFLNSPPLRPMFSESALPSVAPPPPAAASLQPSLAVAALNEWRVTILLPWRIQAYSAPRQPKFAAKYFVSWSGGRGVGAQERALVFKYFPPS